MAGDPFSLVYPIGRDYAGASGNRWVCAICPLSALPTICVSVSVSI